MTVSSPSRASAPAPPPSSCRPSAISTTSTAPTNSPLISAWCRGSAGRRDRDPRPHHQTRQQAGAHHPRPVQPDRDPILRVSECFLSPHQRATRRRQGHHRNRQKAPRHHLRHLEERLGLRRLHCFQNRTKTLSHWTIIIGERCGSCGLRAVRSSIAPKPPWHRHLRLILVARAMWLLRASVPSRSNIASNGRGHQHCGGR